MALTGDLGSIDLAHVFQMLLLSQKTGTLEVRSRGTRTELWLNGDGVLYPFDRDAFPAKVVRLLLRGGSISEEQLAKARASLGVLKRDELSVLIHMHAVTEDDVAAAFRAQMQEEIYELFVDRAATFAFRENTKPAEQGKVIDEGYLLSGNGLIMEAARRLDEWGYIQERVSSSACVFETGAPLEQVPETDRDGALVDVYNCLDGRRPVSAVVETTGLTRFTVCKKLASLVEQHIVYAVPLEVLLERAGRCLREHDFARGLALLERAFELGASEPQVHEMAALANQSMQRLGAACEHYARVAEALEKAGDRRAAAEVHLRIRDLMPTDLKARERLVRHWIDDSAFFADTPFDGEHEAVELALLLKEVGREEQARALLIDVQGRFRDDPRATWKLAEVALELGDPKGAVAMLMSCADEQLAKRAHGPALRLYRRVRMIEPNHEGIEVRIATCERQSLHARPHATPHLRAAAAFIVAGAAALSFVAYNREALADLERIDTEELALHGDFDAAIHTLEAFRSDHPISVAALVANGRIRELGERASDCATQSKQREGLLDADRVRRQRAAERSYADAVVHMQEGDYSASYADFVRAGEYSTSKEWLEQNKPDAKAKEIENYLNAARTQAADVNAARERDDLAEVHRLSVALLEDHPFAPEAKLLKLPVQINADPAGCTVEVVQEGERAPSMTVTAPVLLWLPGRHSAALTFRRAGRVPLTVRVRPEESFTRAFTLDRLPDAVYARLDPAPLWPPLVANDCAWFACDNGRIVVLKDQSLDLFWHASLPDLEEIAGPLALDERGLRVVARSGHVFWLDPSSGVIQGRGDGAAPARPTPPAGAEISIAVAGGRFAVHDGGRIAWYPADGGTPIYWHDDAAPSWGVAASKRGALFGQGARVIRIDAPEDSH